MSAQEFVDESEFQSHVLDAICKASEPQESIFTDVKSSWGESVVNLINETADGRSTRSYRVRMFLHEKNRISSSGTK
ncbi:hypothetical protein N7455_001952 [Penicillium solitum]|uniref:uncharacterized protein n=1 Tax=Penicillium solitum TaxID=60172 RepID=UPI0032C45A2D|nr:hypothetical protein N7455_001952 [Penicillium solitum]